MRQTVSLFGGVVENPLTRLAERHLDGRRYLRPSLRHLIDPFPNFLVGDIGADKDPADEGARFAKQAKEKVFSFDGGSATLGGLVTCEEKRATSQFRVSLEHHQRVR